MAYSEYTMQRILFYWFKGGYTPTAIAEKQAREGIKVCLFLTTDTRLHGQLQLTLTCEHMRVMNGSLELNHTPIGP